MSGPDSDKRGEIWSYLIGFGLALGLTAAAFAAVRWQALNARASLALVLALGLSQMIVHVRLFLRVRLNRTSRDKLALILFSGLIIALMVSGTLVILFNLRERMM